MNDTATICAHCGKELPHEARFCLNCGKRVMRRSDASGSIAERLQRALGANYEVAREIGRGGFGVVYSVRDLQLDRLLAVKVIRPEYVSSDVIVARFRRETKIVAQLKHPNVLEVSFVGEGEGLVYCAMPQIIGETLLERIRREGPLAIDQALRVFTEIGLGLDHAHAKGIIHRDVTPSNIMLDREAIDRAVLLDFGIAKALLPTGGKLSISGQIIGSPEYMSPERRSGSKSVDGRADIYSMGVVAFEMLAGRLPFRVGVAKSGVLSAAPVHLPDVRTVRPGVSEQFAQSITRCVAASPDERWSTALAAVDAAG